MYIGLHVQCRLFLSDFNVDLIFCTDFLKFLTYKFFMKIRPVGAELFHAEGRTDGHGESNSFFWQFCQHA
jgi:hypothetical protein